MCIYVYIASSVPLRLIPYEKDAPHISVEELQPGEEEVKVHFTKEFTYYVGAQGCGCEFQVDQYPGAGESEDFAAMKRSLRNQLAEYLRDALHHQQSIELYACWAGDESCPEEFRVQLSPTDLMTTRTFFREREFMLIVPD